MGDERILGSSEFVQEILAQVQGRVKYQITPEDAGKRADRDLETICQEEGITQEQVLSGSRRHPIPKVRKKLARHFILEYGLSLAETARRLGVTASAVSRMLERKE